MSNVEIFCTRTSSYQECFISDFDSLHGCYRVYFENSWKSARWVTPDKLRFAPEPPTNDWCPKLGERVECEAKMDDDQPWSWFKAQVCGRGEHNTIFQVRFSATKQKEIVSIDSLRPLDKVKNLPVTGVHQVSVRLPHEVPEECVSVYGEVLIEIARETGTILIELETPTQLKVIGTVFSIRQASQLIANIDFDELLISPHRQRSTIAPLQSELMVDDEKDNVPSIFAKSPSFTPSSQSELLSSLSPSYSNLEEEVYSRTSEIEISDAPDSESDDDDDEALRWVQVFEDIVQNQLQNSQSISMPNSRDKNLVDSAFPNFELAISHPYVRGWIVKNSALNNLVKEFYKRNRDFGQETFSRNVHVLWCVYLGSLRQRQEVNTAQSERLVFSESGLLIETAL